MRVRPSAQIGRVPGPVPTAQKEERVEASSIPRSPSITETVSSGLAHLRTEQTLHSAHAGGGVNYDQQTRRTRDRFRLGIVPPMAYRAPIHWRQERGGSSIHEKTGSRLADGW